MLKTISVLREGNLSFSCYMQDVLSDCHSIAETVNECLTKFPFNVSSKHLIGN
jgi:hypothetical protein